MLYLRINRFHILRTILKITDGLCQWSSMCTQKFFGVHDNFRVHEANLGVHKIYRVYKRDKVCFISLFKQYIQR